MQTLALSLKTRGQDGAPLPPVFHQLDRLGLKFRRGWVHLIVAAPGCGKSAMSSFMSIEMDYTGSGDKVPGLYFSPDNDKMTWGKSAVAKAMNCHVNEAEKLIETHDEGAWKALGETTGHLWVSFQSSPSPADIREEIDAFASTYGDWPHTIWIDNIMDVDISGGGDDEHSGQNAFMQFLRKLARDTGAAIYVLAHVTGKYSNGTDPIPREGIMNKIDKIPQVVLSLFIPDNNQLGICVLKNRGGRAKADGTFGCVVPWIPEMGFFGTGDA